MKAVLLSQNIRKQQKIYSSLYAHFGADTRSLHWSSDQTQLLRFEQLLSVGDIDGAKVLDIGCAFGDFFAFLQLQNISVNYTGIDIVPQFIRIAKKRYLSACFEVRDILTLPMTESYDYVFASGVFAFGSRLFFNEMCRTAFKTASRAFAFNLYEPSGSDTRFFGISRPETLRFLKTLDPAQLKYKDNYLERDTTYLVYK